MSIIFEGIIGNNKVSVIEYKKLGYTDIPNDVDPFSHIVTKTINADGQLQFRAHCQFIDCNTCIYKDLRGKSIKNTSNWPCREAIIGNLKDICPEAFV